MLAEKKSAPFPLFLRIGNVLVYDKYVILCFQDDSSSSTPQTGTPTPSTPPILCSSTPPPLPPTTAPEELPIQETKPVAPPMKMSPVALYPGTSIQVKKVRYIITHLSMFWPKVLISPDPEADFFTDSHAGLRNYKTNSSQK